MKKLSILLSCVFMFVSCSSDDSKSDTIPLQERTVSMEIDSIFSKYERVDGGDKYVTRKIDPGKAAVLAAADALGGAFAWGGGPYAVLWGGFGMSYMIEDIVYGQGYSVPNESDAFYNDGLYKSDLGLEHNKLLVEANTNYKGIDLVDVTNRKYLKDFLNKNTSDKNFEKIFVENEKSFYTLMDNGKKSIVNKELSFDKLKSVSNIKFTKNEEDIIKGINEKIKFVNSENVTPFLKDVENYVVKSPLFNKEEKERVFVYTGILNSSYKYWNAAIVKY